MIRPHGTASTLAGLLGLVALFWPRPALAASFTVQDVRAAREIAETTELYIDGKLVRAFRLDAAQPRIELPVHVEARQDPGGHDTHSYGLCGTITVRNADGGAEVHEVNASGLLHDPDGHRFEALGAEDFTRFYLADPDTPQSVETTSNGSSLCRAPIS